MGYGGWEWNYLRGRNAHFVILVILKNVYCVVSDWDVAQCGSLWLFSLSFLPEKFKFKFTILLNIINFRRLLQFLNGNFNSLINLIVSKVTSMEFWKTNKMAADRCLTRRTLKKLSPWKDAASSWPKRTTLPSQDTLPPPALYTYVISHANDMRILFLSFSLHFQLKKQI